MSGAWRNDSISVAKEKNISTRSDELSLSEQPRRLLGIRRRNFYINLAVIPTLFFAFLGIELDLGLNKDKDDSSTSSFTLYPGLAVSSSNTTQANVQVFYQNLTTNAIHYRILSGATSSVVKTLALNKAPKTNLCMAATSFKHEGFAFHQLFYVMDGMVMLANITCPSVAPENCSTIFDAAIATGPSHSIAKDSTIAAVYYGDEQMEVGRSFITARSTTLARSDAPMVLGIRRDL